MENIDSLIVILLLIFGIVGLSIFLVLRNQQMEANKAQKRRIVFDARAKQGVWAGATIVTAQHHTSAEEMREFGYGIKRTKNLGKPHFGQSLKSCIMELNPSTRVSAVQAKA